MSATTSLKITGMSCNHCRSNVLKALEAVDGVEDVSVDLEKGSATVEGNAGTEKLISAIQEAGYQAELD